MALHKIKEGTREWEAMKQRERREVERQGKLAPSIPGTGALVRRSVPSKQLDKFSREEEDAHRLSDQLVALTVHIHDRVTMFAVILEEFRDRSLYRILGYDSLKDYVQGTLHLSERRVYQLLSFAEIRKELIPVLGPAVEQITEAQARELKRLPSAERVAVAQTVDFAVTTAPQVRSVVTAHLAQTVPQPSVTPVSEPVTVSYRCPHCGARVSEAEWRRSAQSISDE